MPRFGISEVIRPLSMTKIVAEKDEYLFGNAGVKVQKESESTKPDDEPMTLQVAIQAIKDMYAGRSDYTCIELFTDPKGYKKGVSHVSVCSMKRLK